MSREQRRMDRRQQRAAAGAGKPPSRRTPVKVAGGSGLPAMPLMILGGAIIIVGLVAYLIWQATSGAGGPTGAEAAEQNRSTDIPGEYVEPQGRGHYPGGLSGHVMLPFCDGVAASDHAKAIDGVPFGGGASGSTTPRATPTATSTPNDQTATARAGTPVVPTNCRLSNPPTSGEHLGVARKVDIGGGALINIPPDINVYPDDIEIPRDAIPHILEHAGLFVGWNCKDGDQACVDTAQKLKDLANDRIDNHDNRVVMAHDLDLPEGTFALSSWTRVMTFPYADWDAKKSLAERFMGTNSCRFDPEGFCK